ncbi:hypothetical protein GOP47_0001122 [Adiantum capillus-veneris]|uniref:Queuosine 5'-phosphate N-glycosylase/hydrolase n=1 Tax=Adiantum capillus-veneris TaxID=13818 RepID=A0A9D4ZRD8_ADICA|nr:hypothetical protein GOP47_0000325 [Adiantum capillus-veneris]KAI5084953.1 hypothetical protein GOP47_0001122 [Adiantum capillus-veneris]
MVPCELTSVVRESSAWVASQSSHVFINQKGLEKVVDELNSDLHMDLWDFEGIHYFDGGPLTVQYLFVLDALNFCFWPDADLHYDHVAAGLRSALMADASTFDADRLEKFTGMDLRKILNWPRELPLEEERARLLREIGTELNRSFSGKAANLVAAANGSALTLVNLIASHFPGFRDHCIYKGRQVFIYKRAQIFVADLWGAFKGKSFGAFKDIQGLTMFADYIVPAILRHLGIISYSPSLANKVDSFNELPPGTEEEVEIRACTIVAVEKLGELLSAKIGRQVLTVQLDWWLWSTGISLQSKLPCHRTHTIYY